MTQLSPEALAWLVERLNKSAARLHGQPVSARVVDGDQQLCEFIGEPNSIHLSYLLSLPETMREAAAAILALEAQVETLEKAVINMTDCWTTAGKRATRAEAALREIEKIASWEERDKDAYITQGPSILIRDMRRISTLARSLPAPVEKEKE